LSIFEISQVSANKIEAQRSIKSICLPHRLLHTALQNYYKNPNYPRNQLKKFGFRTVVGSRVVRGCAKLARGGRKITWGSGVCGKVLSTFPEMLSTFPEMLSTFPETLSTFRREGGRRLAHARARAYRAGRNRKITFTFTHGGGSALYTGLPGVGGGTPQGAEASPILHLGRVGEGWVKERAGYARGRNPRKAL